MAGPGLPGGGSGRFPSDKASCCHVQVPAGFPKEFRTDPAGGRRPCEDGLHERSGTAGGHVDGPRVGLRSHA
jgi:hypothetical protein